jgi:hypothetical protein
MHATIPGDAKLNPRPSSAASPSPLREMDSHSTVIIVAEIILGAPPLYYSWATMQKIRRFLAAAHLIGSNG